MTDLFEAEATTTTTLDLRRLQRMQRRATRRKWTLVFIAVGLVLFAIGGSTAFNFLKSTFTTESDIAADYEGVGQGTVTVDGVLRSMFQQNLVALSAEIPVTFSSVYG